jgi:RNA polymerase II C-terminal domain phosphatase-like 3/4
VKVDGCTHPGSFGDMCICCGQKLDGESGVTFGYIHKVYIFSDNYFLELII